MKKKAESVGRAALFSDPMDSSLHCAATIAATLSAYGSLHHC